MVPDITPDGALIVGSGICRRREPAGKGNVFPRESEGLETGAEIPAELERAFSQSGAGGVG